MSLSVLDWDDDTLRNAALEAMSDYGDQALPVPTYTPAAPLFSADSTLAPAAPDIQPEDSTPRFRPELTPPTEPMSVSQSRNVMYDFFEVHKKSETQAKENTKLFKQEIDARMADIAKKRQISLEAAERHAKEVQTKNTWSFFSKIAQYITHAATIVLGIACVATGVGTAAGALLIAAGGLGLLNRVMADTGAWIAITSWFTESEELQMKIAQRIDMGFFFLTLALSVAGGVGAWRAGTFAALQAATGAEAIASKAGQVLTLAGNAASTATRGGEAMTENRLKQIEAQMKLADGGVTLDYEYMNEATKQVEKEVESTKTIGEEIQRAIETRKVDLNS